MKVWNQTQTAIERTALHAAFAAALQTGNTEFFAAIYIPVKIPTSSGMPENWAWENIGLTSQEIAQIYDNFYGENFIVEPLCRYADEPTDYQYAYGKLAKRIESVLKVNKGKYLKLIELNGYTYNPIWNVDGEEIFSYLENNGVTDEKTETGVDSVTFSSVDSEQQTSINTYEGGAAHPAETVKSTANPAVDSDGNPTKNYTRTRAEPKTNTQEKTFTHYNADNNGSDYAVSAADTAFNQAVTGGDKYHTDKRIRRGNIGVIDTPTLIQKQRDIIKDSIIMQFFEDINEQILIGIFDF